MSIDILHIPDLILKLYVLIPFFNKSYFPYDGQNGNRSNGKDDEFNIADIWTLKKSEDNCIATRNSNVVISLTYWTDYEENIYIYIIFTEFCMKMDHFDLFAPWREIALVIDVIWESILYSFNFINWINNILEMSRWL
jgi:hypothetical protein